MELLGALLFLGCGHVGGGLGEGEELFTGAGEGPFGGADPTGLAGGIVGVEGEPGAVEDLVDGVGEFLECCGIGGR